MSLGPVGSHPAPRFASTRADPWRSWISTGLSIASSLICRLIRECASFPSAWVWERLSCPGEVAAQHQKFLRLAAAGVNVFVSSGDAGSNPDQTGHGTGGPLQAEYE